MHHASDFLNDRPIHALRDTILLQAVWHSLLMHNPDLFTECCQSRVLVFAAVVSTQDFDRRSTLLLHLIFGLDEF